MEDFNLALEDVKPAFGAIVETLETYRLNGIIDYGNSFRHLLSSCQSIVQQVLSSAANGHYRNTSSSSCLPDSQKRSSWQHHPDHSTAAISSYTVLENDHAPIYCCSVASLAFTNLVVARQLLGKAPGILRFKVACRYHQCITISQLGLHASHNGSISAPRQRYVWTTGAQQ